MYKNIKTFFSLLQSTFYKENIQSETVGPQQQIATDNQHIMPNQQDHHPNRNINLNNHHHPGGAHMGNMDQGAYFPGTTNAYNFILNFKYII